jgi:hypothetical protein
MRPIPPCHSLGPQCQQIPVTLRIGSLDESPASLDHESTWLLGHTAQISFAELRPAGKDLVVDAVLHVRCRYLKAGESAETGRCAAHGFSGPMPAKTRGAPQPRRLGGDQFRIVAGQQAATLELPFPRRALPVIAEENPCSIAPCTTADHRMGSACCRDLEIEILCPRGETPLEALVRSRQSPYLCKVSREADDALDAEMISACGYLDDAGRDCTLHGRQRSDGRPAKPDLCSEWPPKGKGLHPGCIFSPPPKRRPQKPPTRQRHMIPVQPGTAETSYGNKPA